MIRRRYLRFEERILRFALRLLSSVRVMKLGQELGVESRSFAS